MAREHKINSEEQQQLIDKAGATLMKDETIEQQIEEKFRCFESDSGSDMDDLEERFTTFC